METSNKPFNGISAEQCDVENQKSLLTYRQLFLRWNDWLGMGAGRSVKNTIWQQFTEIMNDEIMFRTLQMAAQKSNVHPQVGSFLAANVPFSRFILKAYLEGQYYAIRRLIEPYKVGRDRSGNKGVISLSRLIEDMKSNTTLITREVFVAFDGAPYFFEEMLEKEKQDRLNRARKEGSFWETISLAEKAAARHSKFDKLSGVDSANRKRDDFIPLSYWDDLRSTFDESVLKDIKNLVNKFLAHAADKKSRITLDEEDKMLSISKIHEAQDLLYKLAQELALTFFEYDLRRIPAYTASDFLHNIDSAFLPSEALRELQHELQTQLDQEFYKR